MMYLLSQFEPTQLKDYKGFIILVAIAFLAVMWGGFFFFDRFKRKDDLKREALIDAVKSCDDGLTSMNHEPTEVPSNQNNDSA
jgi:hypothetical protein